MMSLLPRVRERIRGKSGVILPQNYRKITAKIRKHLGNHSDKYLKTGLTLEILLFLALISICVFLFFEYKNAQRGRVEELKRLAFWEKQMVKFGNYPETYYNAAVHAVRLGDNNKALEYINKSLMINPGFELSKKLKREAFTL